MPTASLVSSAIAALSLVISIATAWLTLFRRGTIMMTQPTTFFFGADGSGEGPPKVFLRTLLFSTAKRGQIVESMFVRVRRAESSQTFNVWVYGEAKLARGSGIYVGHEGLACNHHFLLPRDGTHYEFLPGDYTVDVFATLINQHAPLRLFTSKLHLSNELALALKEKKGVYFDWGPDSATYHAHVDQRPPRALPRGLLDFLDAVDAQRDPRSEDAPQ